MATYISEGQLRKTAEAAARLIGEVSSTALAAIDEVAEMVGSLPTANATYSSGTYSASGSDLPTVKYDESSPTGKGKQIMFIPKAVNSSATPYLKLNSGESIEIRMRSTNPTNTYTSIVPASYFVADMPYVLTFCGHYWLIESFTEMGARGAEIWTGVCKTAASTAAKEVGTLGSNYSRLKEGDIYIITFVNGHSAANLTLNINSQGAKTATYLGSAIGGDIILDGGIYAFFYDGSYFRLIGTNEIGGGGSETLGSNIWYGTTSTASATTTKIVSCPGYTSVDNDIILVRFGVEHTGASLSLNVSGTGAKSVSYGGGKAVGSGLIGAGDIRAFVLTGTSYQMIGTFDGGGSWYGTTTSSGTLVTKTVSCPGFTLKTGATISIKFTYGHTTTSAMSLNVNSTGAKTVKYKGNSVGSGYIQAGGTYTFVYNGTEFEVVGDLGSGHSDTTVSISTSSWSSSTSQAQVYASGVTADALIFVSPAPASWSNYAECGIRCVSQTSNYLTFQAETIPTSAISVNVAIFK